MNSIKIYPSLPDVRKARSQYIKTVQSVKTINRLALNVVSKRPTISKDYLKPKLVRHGKPPTIIQPKFIQAPRPNVIKQTKQELYRKKTDPIRSQIRREGLRRALADQSAILRLKNIGTGRLLVMVAAGPSVLEIDFVPIKDHPLIDFMCINKPFKPIWPTKFWAFCDHTQYLRNQETWNDYNGIIINSLNVTARKSNQIIIAAKAGRGFNCDISQGYHVGRSSTYANMQTAIYMNYDKIYICGLDMGEVPGVGLYHYGVNPDVAKDTRLQRFKDEAQSYLYAAQNLPHNIRDRFIICSSYNKWEFTKHFRTIDHKAMIEDIQKYLGAKIIESNKEK